MTSIAAPPQRLTLSAAHPALPGHFPGRPVVPGVVLLDQVLSQASHWLGRPLSAAALVQAKFTAPLLPEQEAWLHLELQEQRLKFDIQRAGQPIAQGSFRLNGLPV